MPICFDAGSSGHDLAANGISSTEFRESGARCLEIGLINNMPDGALEATERQFVALLDAASGGMAVRISLYALPDVHRNEWGRRRISRYYSGIENLWDRRLDGLIVTGAEPLAPSLPEEPYWGSLTKVLGWAEENTHSTVWSCLAAHAAVLHLDGVARQRRADKLSGVFRCAPEADHPLMAGAPSHRRVPHSRWNDLPANDLTDCGYQILARSKEGGVDTFVKQRKSMFVFFQGHPEYAANTLLLEYRRDIGRYLRREREAYPLLPQGYFDRNTAHALTALQERAMSDRREETLAHFPMPLAEQSVANTWHSAATRVYGNWLKQLCVQKERRLKEKQSRKRSVRALEAGSSRRVAAVEVK